MRADWLPVSPQRFGRHRDHGCNRVREPADFGQQCRQPQRRRGGLAIHASESVGGQLVHAGIRRELGQSGKPVTYLVTTTPGSARPIPTAPDTRNALTCENQT
jgi:hypothetical protein